MTETLIYHFYKQLPKIRSQLVELVHYDDTVSDVSQGYDEPEIEPLPFDRYEFFDELFKAFHLNARAIDSCSGVYGNQHYGFYFDSGKVFIDFDYSKDEDYIDCSVWEKEYNHARRFYSCKGETIQEQKDDLIDARTELFNDKNVDNFHERMMWLFNQSIILATLAKPYDIAALTHLLIEAKHIHDSKRFTDIEYIDLVNNIVDKLQHSK